MNSSLWDLAGVDGLAVAKQLFGEEVGHLGPFQSLETVLEDKDCSVLRLCDLNFRISYPGPLHQLVDPIQANIWLNQFDWLSRLYPPINLLSQIISQATVRPPHRLDIIPNHHAVPAQLHDIPLLIWQHPIQKQRGLELHLACQDRERLASKFDKNHPL
ncbi:MAG: hypothetical protein AAF243_10050 [Cyanobacteria bacterium P01_A01_bin.137]